MRTAVEQITIRHKKTGQVIRYREECEQFSGELLEADLQPTGYAHTARTLEELLLYFETLIVCGIA